MKIPQYLEMSMVNDEVIILSQGFKQFKSDLHVM